MITKAVPSTPETRGGDTPCNDIPGSDVASIYHRLTQINRALRSRGGQAGLSAGTASALWTIVNHSPIRLSTLAQRESVTAPTMSRIVASLEEHGYIERTVDPDDARARLFSATPAGIELISHARSRRAQMLADALARLDDTDRATVHEGLATLADVLDACELDPVTPDQPQAQPDNRPDSRTDR